MPASSSFAFTRTGAAALLLLALTTAHAQDGASGTAAAPYTPTIGQAGKDVVWVPTSDAQVETMLKMAAITPEDYLVDLGSGDGRTVIAAAKRGTRAHGIEYNPDLVALAEKAAADAGVSKTATFTHGDIFESDFTDATVVTLFLLPDLNVKLRPTLLEMPAGTRVVSNSFLMGEWQPDQAVETGENCPSFCRAYGWVVPAKVEGNWQLGDGRALELTQDFQVVTGNLIEEGASRPLGEAKLLGTAFEFRVGDDHYVAQVDGQAMQGQRNGNTDWSAQLQNP